MIIPGLGIVRTFPLKPGTKQPANAHGHLQAVEDREETGNYGIALDGQFLVIDIDKPALVPEKVNRLLMGSYTWVQKTPKGFHYVFTVPEGFEGRNSKLKTDTGEIYGDVKVNGYIVGPGSVVGDWTYQYLECMAMECPQWALEAATKPATDEHSVITRNLAQVPLGSHDSYLTEVAGLAYRQGFTDEAIIEKLMGELKYLAGYDPSDPYTEEIFKRRLTSWKRAWDPPTGVPPDPVVYAGRIAEGREFDDFEFPLFDWYIHGFFPRGGYLVMAFGDAGIGKSTAGAYLTSIVTQMGDRALIMASEDDPGKFRAHAILSGANRELLLHDTACLNFKSPRDVAWLEELVVEREIRFIWFDSIKSHFTVEDGNEATKTRDTLAALADLAQRRKVLIVGLFHINKLGEYSGSAEIKNVCRHMLKFSRKDNEPLVLTVTKSNLYKPPYALLMPAEEIEVVDPENPEKRELWKNKDGTITTRKDWVIREVIEDSNKLQEEIKRDEEYEEYLMICDAIVTYGSKKLAAEKLKIPKTTFYRRLQKFSTKEELEAFEESDNT